MWVSSANKQGQLEYVGADYYDEMVVERKPQEKVETVASLLRMSSCTNLLFDMGEQLEKIMQHPSPSHVALHRLIREELVQRVLVKTEKAEFFLKKVGVPMNRMKNIHRGNLQRDLQCLVVINDFDLPKSLVSRFEKDVSLVVCNRRRMEVDRFARIKVHLEPDQFFRLLYWTLWFEPVPDCLEIPDFALEAKYDTVRYEWMLYVRVESLDSTKSIQDVIAKGEGYGKLRVITKTPREYILGLRTTNYTREIHVHVFILFDRKRIHASIELTSSTTKFIGSSSMNGGKLVG